MPASAINSVRALSPIFLLGSMKAEDWISGAINWLLDVIALHQQKTASVIANFKQVVKEGGAEHSAAFAHSTPIRDKRSHSSVKRNFDLSKQGYDHDLSS